jgi:type IV secretion system protein VirB10
MAVSVGAFGQEQQQMADAAPAATKELVTRTPTSASAKGITLVAGTKVPLVLKAPISTKNARPGDPIYAQTNFPVVINDTIVIPPGTYVQGKVSQVTRPGKIKGRAELLVHFTSLIFPTGYTLLLPGAVDSLPGEEQNTLKDSEGTIRGKGGKAKDAATVAQGAQTGAAVGSLAGISSGRSGTGALMGAGLGGAVGLATVLLSRGPDVRLEAGTALEMVLQRDVVIDANRVVTKN